MSHCHENPGLRKTRSCSLHRSLLLPLFIGAGGVVACASGLTFENSALRVLEETPERNTGLDKIYVCYDTNGVDLVYESPTTSNVKIYKFSNLGGAFSEELKNVEFEGDRVIYRNVEGDCGYIVEDGSNRYYYWVVNYLPHRFAVKSIEPGESDCDATMLNFEGDASPIHYFTINGQQRVLSRDIKVIYDTQTWNAESKEFSLAETAKNFESFSNSIRITPPAYASTSFRVEGDKFLEAWNWLAEYETIVINPSAVSVQTEAVQDGDAWQQEAEVAAKEKAEKENQNSGNSGASGDASAGDENDDTSADDDASTDSTESQDWVSNQIRGDSDGLGGSAPAEIEFFAYPTDAVIHHEWQMSTDPEFNTIDYRFNQQNLDYTFNDEGTFYLRYIGSNSDGTCEAIGDTYTVQIGASELLCPNAFSPNEDGVNDEWKVSYRSIIEFKCWIFDRYGAQICHFENPEMGWDGKRGGKYVKPGVYYYVIQATGADGKKYKLSGDINIIGHRLTSGSISQPEE